MQNKKSLPIVQQTIVSTSKLYLYLQQYYAIRWLRVGINLIYIINEILLALYLLFIPIQVAYYWLLSNGENAYIQTSIDIAILVLFIVHILLYLDEKCYEIMKNPYAIIWKKIVSIQLIYDIFAVILAIYAVAAFQKSLGERIVELIFFLKIYKLIKFDRKAMYFVIGTGFYIFYKVLRTLLIVFMAIAFVGSMFYGIAYLQYVDNVYIDMLWIVSCTAITECVEQPFIIQLEYAMYWALGTASTAAYGDISATQPIVMIVNILALAFQGFLFGFYLNSMHSIPLENQKKEADLLHKFDSFQQHSSNRKLDSKLYLQILCSLQYTQSQKKSLQSIEKVMPRKYIQQIKYNIYHQFLNKKQFFLAPNTHNLGHEVQLRDHILVSNPQLFHKEKQLLFVLSDIVLQTVCEINQNVYDYANIDYDHLFFVKDGSVNYSIETNKQHPYGATDNICNPGECFGQFSFFSGLRIPSKAICTNYSIILSISRKEFKKVVGREEKLELYQKFKRSIYFKQPLIYKEPIMKYIESLEINQCQIINDYNLIQKHEKLTQIFSQKRDRREKFRRENIRTKRIVQSICSKTKNKQTQTQSLLEDDPINLIDVFDSHFDTNKSELRQINKAESMGKISDQSHRREKNDNQRKTVFMIEMT